MRPTTPSGRQGPARFRHRRSRRFYAAREANGVTFTQAPTPMHGSHVARFLDSEGAETSLSG
jgi:hypothetical protein